jgi:hypothetical protein
MLEKSERSKVNGFLKAKARTIVNGKGEEIILSGWGLGNWLLCEGYMWLSFKSGRFDRPRRMEAVLKELCGIQYAQEFWRKFRDNYVTEQDIKAMAEAGFNSVRIPMNWRLFMEDGEDIVWKEEGFCLIDRCLDWCEKHSLYAFLDLHGAPGGQTGSNIDDSLDDVPRLFIDENSWKKGIALWKKLAARYCGRWIVGGYDLLNEPIRPAYDNKDYDYLLPRLSEFYDMAAAAIREVDKEHLLSIEGHHWATDNSIFYKKYDDNMILHFHRYGCLPDMGSIEEYIEVSKRLNVPLWLGETGENVNEWYTAFIPLAASCGIGYNMWTWKKMDCTNSPYSIKIPEGWRNILQYTEGGPHPGYNNAREIFDRYLENIKIENCDYHQEVINSVLRQPGCQVRATDFDEFPGKGKSYSGVRPPYNIFKYRAKTAMEIVELNKTNKKFAFDCLWDRFALELKENEFAVYTINNVSEGTSVSLELYCDNDSELVILQDQKVIGTLDVKKAEKRQKTKPLVLTPASESRISVITKQGCILLEIISFDSHPLPIRQ